MEVAVNARRGKSQNSRVFELDRLEGLVLLRSPRQRQRSGKERVAHPRTETHKGARAGESKYRVTTPR